MFCFGQSLDLRYQNQNFKFIYWCYKQRAGAAITAPAGSRKETTTRNNLFILIIRDKEDRADIYVNPIIKTPWFGRRGGSRTHWNKD